MADFDTQTVIVDGDRVTLAVPVTSPVQRGTIDVSIAMHRHGGAVDQTLTRVVVVKDGRISSVDFFSSDLRRLFPRGAKIWLVVRYAGQLLASGPVTVVVP